MKRAYLLCLLLVFLAACSNPISNASSSGNSAKREAQVEQFVKSYLAILQDNDWDAFAELHWSEGEFSPSQLEEAFKPILEKTEGKLSSYELAEYVEYDQGNYLEYIDEEELPGSPELVRGSVEFFLLSDDPNDKDIYVWITVCEEDGKFKVFKYTDLSRE